MGARKSRQQWARIVAAFERSGASAEQFCERRRIKPGTLRWWRWQLRDCETVGSASEVRLVPVEVITDSPIVASVAAPTSLVVAVCGVSVRVEVGTDAAYVAALVAELGRRC
jgi:hypothetical protein